MKTRIITFFVLLLVVLPIQAFVLSNTLKVEDKKDGEQSYCAYDDLTGVCKMRNKGVACYMVFADCTFVEN